MNYRDDYIDRLYRDEGSNTEVVRVSDCRLVDIPETSIQTGRGTSGQYVALETLACKHTERKGGQGGAEQHKKLQEQ